MKKLIIFSSLAGLTMAFAFGVAAHKTLDGPAKPKGLKMLGAIEAPLKGEIPNLEKRHLRMRHVSIEPGGVVHVHSHAGRPGLAFIISGEVIEHRDDQDGPITRSAGSFILETKGVSHWFENKSGEIAKAVVVDVYEKKDEK